MSKHQVIHWFILFPLLLVAVYFGNEWITPFIWMFSNDVQSNSSDWFFYLPHLFPSLDHAAGVAPLYIALFSEILLRFALNFGMGIAFLALPFRAILIASLLFVADMLLWPPRILDPVVDFGRHIHFLVVLWSPILSIPAGLLVGKVVGDKIRAKFSPKRPAMEASPA